MTRKPQVGRLRECQELHEWRQGGYVFHVLNRGNERRTIFEADGDYLAFLRVMAETAERVPVRIPAWSLMSNHWHLVLWPKQDGELGQFMQRLTTTHVRRWRLLPRSVGPVAGAPAPA